MRGGGFNIKTNVIIHKNHDGIKTGKLDGANWKMGIQFPFVLHIHNLQFLSFNLSLIMTW